MYTVPNNDCPPCPEGMGNASTHYVVHIEMYPQYDLFEAKNMRQTNYFGLKEYSIVSWAED